MDVVTIRAVRVEAATLLGLQAFLRPGGELFLFRGSGDGGIDYIPPPMKLEAEEPLVESLRSRLMRIQKVGDPRLSRPFRGRMFHVEHSSESSR